MTDINIEKELEKRVQQWVKTNHRTLIESNSECAVTFYLKEGKIEATKAEIGAESEVSLPPAPPNTIEVGSVHNHTGCVAEMSPWDEETGQKIAKQTGRPYHMWIVAPTDELEGHVEITHEIFEP